MDGSIKCTSYNFCTLCVLFDVGLCGMNGECGVVANSIKMAKNGRENWDLCGMYQFHMEKVTLCFMGFGEMWFQKGS